jgi:predicted neuraminidase
MATTATERSGPHPLKVLMALAAALVLTAAEHARHPDLPLLPQAGLPAPLAPGEAAAIGASGRPDVTFRQVAQGHLPMPANTPSAHASNLLTMPAGHSCVLKAFWFAGTRESAPDVQIVSSCFERSTRQWRAAQTVVNRHVFGAELGFGLRRLGNPVSWRDGGGKVHLFVVATGLGGWAASRIMHLTQSDAGQDPAALAFGKPEVLPLSWLWNKSVLVRAAPMPLQDGGMLLPVYFELGVKYPLALRFDAAGRYQGSMRLSQRWHLLQPNLLPLAESHWLALMRDNHIDGRVALAETLDAGRHWHDLPDTPLVNPDSSVAALALAPGLYALAHNSSPHSRQILDLSRSTDGVTWTLARTLASGGSGYEFSYPAMAVADGELWVSYTEGRTRIAWQRFALEPKP